MKNALEYMYNNSTACICINENEQNRFEELMKKTGNEYIPPCKEDYEHPFPVYFLSRKLGEYYILLNTANEHTSDNWGALDCCTRIINVEMLEKDLV
jgi:hypothetical protein